ncbi:PH domain-containing protein [Ureibacillus sp. FSL K6-8385]|uniref:PH domain-containing protein n=1 Tax=Ureibacillus sp. FSL K6-8385 TaxID=2954684 RepID=UPI003158F6ED
MMYEKYRLHPISAFINFLKALKELLFPLIILVIVNGFNFKADGKEIWEYIPLFIFLLVVIFYLISGIVKWFTFVYWFEDNELRVEYGLFVKKKRYIPFDRIQSFNYKESIFHRIFGLVEVTVETAGSTNGRPEAEFTAITREAAARIERETKKLNIGQDKDDEINVEIGGAKVSDQLQEEAHVIHKMSAKDLLLLATTSNSVGVVIAGVAALFSQIAEYIPTDWIVEEIAAMIQFGFIFIMVIIFLAFLFAWILSVMITFINYYDFTVVQENDRIIITRGLLERKRIIIPNNRVQGIKIIENPLRQFFRYATVVVESASWGFGQGDTKIMLFPLISKKEMSEPLQYLFPQFTFDLEGEFVRPPKKSRPHFYRVYILSLIPIIGLSSYFFYPAGLLSIFLALFVLIMGLWQYKTNGYLISGNQLTLRYRVISRVTFIAEKKRIQVIQKRQNFFQKRKKIATVQATVMSGLAGATARVPHLDESDADAILSWFERTRGINKESA